MTGNVEMESLQAVGTHCPARLAHPLVLVILLASAHAQSQSDLRREPLKPDAPTANTNAFTGENQLKSSIPHIRTTLLRTTNSEKSGGTSVYTRPSPTSSLTQEEEAGNPVDSLVEDRHLLKLRSPASITKDTLKKADYRRPNINVSAGPRDNGSDVTLRVNTGYMESDVSEKPLKSPYTNMEEDSHLIFHFVVVCFFVTMIYIIYYNKSKVIPVTQRRKWRTPFRSKSKKCFLDQNVNEAMPSLNTSNDYIF